MSRRNRIVTLKEARMLKAQGYTEICNNWYRGYDNKLYKDQTGFSDNSNQHRLSAPRILDVASWIILQKQFADFILLRYRSLINPMRAPRP